MNTIKTLFMAIVLSAVGYGAYVVLTGPSDSHPPAEAAAWGVAPHVDMPSASSAPQSAPVAPKILSASSPATPDSSSHDASAATTNWPTVPGAASVAAGSNAPGTSISSINGTSNDPFSSSPTTAATGTSPGSDPFAPAVAAAAGSASATTSTSPATPGAAASAGTDPTMSNTAPATRLQETPAVATSAAAPADDVRAEFSTAWETAQQQLAANRYDDALLELSKWVTDSRLSAGDRDRLLELLDQLAGTVIYSRQHLLAPAYQVKPGETLEQIATQHEVPMQLLMNINGIADPQQVRPGDALKVVQGPFDVLVDMQSNQLTLFLHHMYAGRFPIYIGQDQPVQEGEYKVLNKVAKPTYQAPSGQTIGPEDPANPLGAQLLELGNKISIHGSSNTPTGSVDSRGSIRMSATDINDVYNIVSVGSHVMIWR